MKIYTGVDIVSNYRIKKAYDKFGEKFLKKIYTDREIQYCMKKRDFIGCLAARFAAKEAFVKAFYKRCGYKPLLRCIEVYGEEGKPANIILHLEDTNLKTWQIDISISHEKECSVASVVITFP